MWKNGIGVEIDREKGKVLCYTFDKINRSSDVAVN